MFNIPQTQRPARPVTQPSNPPQVGAPNQQGGPPVFNPINTRPRTDPPNMGAGGSTNVQVNAPDFDQFRDFGDIVMQEYQRTTAPQIEQQRARMNQDLVNRGLTPGSEAYEREMDRFMRSENDLFGVAQRGAVEQGLFAQNQAFNQGLGQANINAGLKQTAMNNQTSRYGTDQNLAGLMAQLGQRESEFGRNFGQGQYEFDRGMNLTEGQADFGNLMQMLGFGSAMTQQNNNALYNDRQAAGGIVGGFMPSAPIIPINAGGAFGTATNAQQARFNADSQNSNQLFGGLGQLGSALIRSDRNIKTDFKPVSNDAELEALRKVEVSRWRYKDDEREHIGPMAQDFGQHVTDEPDARMIHGVDAIGTLIASVQALADRIDALEVPDVV